MHTLKIKPLSVNDAYKGRKYKTSNHHKFKDHITILLKNKRILKLEKKERFYILYHFYISNIQNDVDNLIKLTQDAICNKIGTDDRYIMGIHAKKFIVKKGQEHIKFKIFKTEKELNKYVQAQAQ